MINHLICLTPKRVSFIITRNSENSPLLKRCQSNHLTTPKPLSKTNESRKRPNSLRKANRIVFSISELISLSEENKQLVFDAESNPDLQFIVAKNEI